MQQFAVTGIWPFIATVQNIVYVTDACSDILHAKT